MSTEASQLEPVKRYLVKSITSEIITSEDICSHELRTRLRNAPVSPDSASPSSTLEYSPSSDDEPSHTRKATTPLVSDGDSDDDYKHEKPCKYDDVEEELSTPLSSQCETTPEDTATSQSLESLEEFLGRYPTPEYSSGHVHAKLTQPVILLQKRLETRSHSFIRAYAPSLEVCGIPEDMFLDFLTNFDTSIQSWPSLDVVNLASIGLLSVSQFPMLVGVAIQASLAAAKQVQNRARTNSFLDKVNTQIFMPRGLYCLITTYAVRDGENPAQPLEGTNLQSAITSNFSSTDSRQERGHMYPEAEMPASAPLVFPGLKAAASSEGEESKKAKEKVKRAQLYIMDYYDKRSRARFAGKHVGGGGIVKGPTRMITSRVGNSNHAVGSGSFRSLITGGYITPPDIGRIATADYERSDGGRRRRELRKKRRDDDLGGLCVGRRGVENRRYGYGSDKYQYESRQLGQSALHASQRSQLSCSQTQSPTLSRNTSKDQNYTSVRPDGITTPETVVKRAFRKNMLYMMIVNMPSDEELALATEHLRQSRTEGIHMLDFITHLRGH